MWLTIRVPAPSFSMVGEPLTGVPVIRPDCVAVPVAMLRMVVSVELLTSIVAASVTPLV